MPYTQTGRGLSVATPLGPDVLLLAGFRGEEAISHPFHFTLEMLSDRSEIAPASVLRRPMCVTLDLPGNGQRHIHGLVSRFARLGTIEGLTSYRAELVPWFWFMNLSRDCRVFQHQSVLEIATQLFKEQGGATVAIRTTRRYPKREFCVQYRESAFNFLARLFEHEGISWFFEHGPAAHTLVLVDVPSANRPCLGPATTPVRRRANGAVGEDVVVDVVREDAVHPTRVTFTDYDPLHPSLDLTTGVEGATFEEVFDYPGRYASIDEGERLARLALEACESDAVVIEGSGTARYFTAGAVMQLREHEVPGMNGRWTLTMVSHEGRGGDVRSWASAPFDYRNTFRAVPSSTPFRPRGTAHPARVQGTQPALVVGPEGKEVHVDRYGRVRVHFPWDRRGARNDSASCWVRVASSWAGKGWGGVSHPRIGQEVIVDFLEGDPDQPIIVGRVYNAEQMPPYELPAGANRSGLKSSSVAGTGYNEISLDDSGGTEGITIHAQKNMRTKVRHDCTETVGNTKATKVKKAYTIHAETIEISADVAITLSVGAARFEMSQAGIITTTGTMVSTAAAVSIQAAAPVISNAAGMFLSAVGVGMATVTGVNYTLAANVTIEGGTINLKA